MKVAAWLRRYSAHPDPATAAVNFVALVLAGNGPFYPLYALALIGSGRAGAWLTTFASPFFFAVPALSRRHPLAGRTALPMIGIANTVWCAALLGCGSEVQLFLLPCIALAALLSGRDERRLALFLTGLPLGVLIALTELPLAGLMQLGRDELAALARLNTISAGTLTGFLALTLANVLRGSGALPESCERR
jgi:hypothetical protein